MNKSQFIAFAFVTFVVMAGINDIGQIRFLDDNVNRGGEVEIHANIINKGNKEIDDSRLTVFIPELGLFMPIGHFDIKHTRPIGKMIHFDVDGEPGEYLVRIRSFSNGHAESRYRHIIID